MGTRGVKPSGGGEEQASHSPSATKPFGHGSHKPQEREKGQACHDIFTSKSHGRLLLKRGVGGPFTIGEDDMKIP